MVSFAKDPPNICSLAGLLCALIGIYYAILGNFNVALIGVLWAIVFDWYDGIVARKISGRTDRAKSFGAQLDSLIDIVSFGVFPAIFLLSYSHFNPWFIPGAFLILAADVIRLSYFNVYGMIDSKYYKGLAIDNNILILAFVFLFEGLFPHSVFSIILYVLLIVLLVFNLASIPTYKFPSKWIYVLLLYTVAMTVVFGYRAIVGCG